MTELNRRQKLLKAIEIAERCGNTFMAQNIRVALSEVSNEARGNGPHIGPKDVF